MKISLITISYKNPKELELTIKSVKKNYRNYVEYIVVLGSNDEESINVIKMYQSIITKKIIEPDKGIYDALNKGIKNSTGDIICFIHSGDTINKNYFDIISNNIKKYDYIYGGLNFITKNNNKIKVYPKEISKSKNNLFNLSILHPGLIVKKKVYNFLGYFNNRFILSDKLWMLKLVKSRFIGKKIPNILVNFRMNGSSSSYSMLSEYYIQLKKLNLKFYKIFFVLIKIFAVINYYKFIYYVR
jgi:glycosyltransferase